MKKSLRKWNKTLAYVKIAKCIGSCISIPQLNVCGKLIILFEERFDEFDICDERYELNNVWKQKYNDIIILSAKNTIGVIT